MASARAATQLIHDTTIVTADDAGSILHGAALAVSDGRISALGPTPEILTQYPDARRIDGRGRAVFPGFANTHTHLSRVLARGIYEDLSPSHTPPFPGGLAPLPLPVLSPDEERVMALLGALEAIRSGTTAASGSERARVGSRRRLHPDPDRSAKASPHARAARRLVLRAPGAGQRRRGVMVEGRWIMRDGRVLTLDETAIVAEADRIARAAWRRLFERRPELAPPPGFDLGTR